MPLKFSLVKAKYNIIFFFLLKLSMESLAFDQSPNLYFNVSKNARVCVRKLSLRLLKSPCPRKILKILNNFASLIGNPRKPNQITNVYSHVFLFFSLNN